MNEGNGMFPESDGDMIMSVCMCVWVGFVCVKAKTRETESFCFGEGNEY